MKQIRLETTSPFQGLAELVADDEGLFAAEGVEVEWVERANSPREVEPRITTPDGLSAFSSHGEAFEKGGADMYNACEWGNYRRVQDTGAKGRQLGRRSIMVWAGIVVAPNSEIFSPQQLANKMVAVPYYFGTHYLTYQILEGFLPRDLIKTCRAPNGSAARYDALINGEVEATTLTEPYLTVAEKEGCRIIAESMYHGTEVASDEIDAETYAAFTRAVKKAVRLINADKKRFVHYFIDRHKGQHPSIEQLTVNDFRLSRIQMVDPAPIPEEELQRTYEWMRSWNMIDELSPDVLVDVHRQQVAHEVAAE
ncbi:MAG: ABC transporter substrate-binding protein [Pseudomonadota bacterium]|nr:ABC transporter substrate-binding protein [Pseudomonadota bacterium]